MKHTLGKWQIDRSEGKVFIKTVPGQIICEVDPLPEMEANLRLIQQAPVMLEALKGSHKFFTRLYDRLVNAGEDSKVLEKMSLTLEAMTIAIENATPPDNSFIVDAGDNGIRYKE